jgi:hypothetical protein
MCGRKKKKRKLNATTRIQNDNSRDDSTETSSPSNQETAEAEQPAGGTVEPASYLGMILDVPNTIHGLTKSEKGLIPSFLHINGEDAGELASAIINPGTAIACHDIAENFQKVLGTGDPINQTLKGALNEGNRVIHVAYKGDPTGAGHSFTLIVHDGKVEMLEAWAGTPPRKLGGKEYSTETAGAVVDNLFSTNISERYGALRIFSDALADAPNDQAKQGAMKAAFGDKGDGRHTVGVTVRELKDYVDAKASIETNRDNTVAWMKRPDVRKQVSSMKQVTRLSS